MPCQEMPATNRARTMSWLRNPITKTLNYPAALARTRYFRLRIRLTPYSWRVLHLRSNSGRRSSGVSSPINIEANRNEKLRDAPCQWALLNEPDAANRTVLDASTDSWVKSG